MGKGRTGASMGVESAPARKKRRAAYLRRQEKRWAAKSGPVTIRHVDPKELRREA